MMLEIQKATHHAESLTRQLLAFSRRQHLQPKVINLNAVLTDIRDLLRRMIGEDLELVTSLAPDLGAVKADPGQIQQVIMNLAVNARDAMPEGGRLTITTANADVGAAALAEPGAVMGPCVRLTVSDTGYGMDPATQARVFEPFFTTKERGKGTGLGLSTVYGIVKQSGGHIRIRSLPGVGTAFEIDLPRVNEPLSGTERRATEPLARGSGTILVVEDQDDVRRLVAASLRRCGYEVLDAANGEAAIQLCRAHPGPIALMLLDVVMPGMNGPAVSRACLEIRPGTKVLFMSGYTDSALQEELGAAGPPAYLQKPFTPVQLAEKVREVLRG
jgi:CheY-like chemotaxis protein